MCTSEILSRLNTIEYLLKKLIEHGNQETSKPLTFKEACAYLGYTQSYLYKLTYKKIIPHYKPTGKMIFFSKNEVDEWVFKNAEGKGQRATQDTAPTESIKDPNQEDLFEKSQKKKPAKETAGRREKEDGETEILIEFPLKSRRKQ